MTDRFGRTNLLNIAADTLGFDNTTRRAMTHLEVFINEMSKRNITWEEVPEKLDFPALLPGITGKLILRAARRTDEGFVAVEAAIAYPVLRPPLLSAYVECLEIAAPSETSSIMDTVRYLRQSY